MSMIDEAGFCKQVKRGGNIRQLCDISLCYIYIY